MDQASRKRIGDSRRSWRLVPATFMISYLVAVVVIVVSGRRVGAYVRDPGQLGELEPFEGGISLIGVGVLAMAVGLLVSALPAAPADSRRGLGSMVLLTAGLFVDDALLFHDQIIPAVGVPEPLIILGYGTIGLFLLWMALPVLERSGTRNGFAAAVGAFAASTLLDLIEPEGLSNNVLFAVEDGLKMLGISLWLTGSWMLSRWFLDSTAGEAG